MADASKSLLERVQIQPAEKQSDELRNMIGRRTSNPLVKSNPVQKKLDARLTQYSEGSSEMIDQVRDMLETNPDNEGLLDWLAFMMYTNERLSEAVTLYERLIELNSKNSQAYYYLANCYFKMGRSEQAIMGWRQALILSPESKVGRKSKARISMARAKIFGNEL